MVKKEELESEPVYVTKFDVPSELEKLGILHITKIGDLLLIQTQNNKWTFVFETYDIDKTTRSFEYRSKSMDTEVRNAVRKFLLQKCEQIDRLRKIEMSEQSNDKEYKLDLNLGRTEPISISKALTLNPGDLKVTGRILSLSKSYKVLTRAVWHCHNKDCNLITTCTTIDRLDIENITHSSCPQCFSNDVTSEHEYEYRIEAKLQDEEGNNNPVFLNTIFAGEGSYGLEEGNIVTVLGKLKFERDRRRKDTRLFPVLHVREICSIIKHENNWTAIFGRHLEDILKEEKSAMALNFLVEEGCKRDPSFCSYLGKDKSMRGNWKLRTIVNSILKTRGVKMVKHKPLMLCYESDEDEKYPSHTSHITSLDQNM